jgi:hypothetical protein
MLMAKGIPTYLNPNAVRRNRVELLPVLSGLMIASELTRGPDIQTQAPTKKGRLI